MISQGASEINISFVIQESDVPHAVRHLHARFSRTLSASDSEETRAQLIANGHGGTGYETVSRCLENKTKGLSWHPLPKEITA